MVRKDPAPDGAQEQQATPKASRKRAKPTKKKAARREQAPPPQKSSSTLGIALIAISLVALLALGIYMLIPGAGKDTRDDTSATLVTVDGEPITQAELDFQYGILPPEMQMAFSREEVLEQVINEELVVQEARAAGIEAGDAQVRERIAQVLADSGLSEEELAQNLAALNMTMERFEELIAREMLIEGLLEQRVQVPAPDDATLRALYASLEAEYAQPAQVRARHILVGSEREGAAQLAQDIHDQVRAGADFCALVENSSDDPGSLATCGEYTFPRGMMVEEFEQAGFEMEPGEFRVVQTQFGYHVIEKLEDIPEGVRAFEQVRDELVERYESAERARSYQALIASLREGADILYADGREPPRQEIPVVPVTGPEPTQDATQENGTDASEPEPVQEPTPGTLPEEILSCIASKATLYGADWSTDTRDARRTFSAAGVDITYVACDARPQQCADAGVQAYPTWEIDGELYLGRLSVEELALAAGC